MSERQGTNEDNINHHYKSFVENVELETIHFLKETPI